MTEHTKNVGLAELVVTESSEVINTIGIGSCICLILYDNTKRIGGLAHIMLPRNPSGNNANSKKGKYADTAINEMLTQMEMLGSHIKDIKAKLFGGANMFPSISSEILGTIGSKNYEAVRAELERKRIKIVAQDIGGNEGRTIFFNTHDGSVLVKMKNREIVV